MSSQTVVARRIQRHIANLENEDGKVALRAEGYLIRYGSRAVEWLVPACSHPNPQVRYHAVWALGHSHDPRAFDTILALTHDPEESVFYDAILALGIHGDPRAIAPLIALLEGATTEDTPETIRASAAIEAFIRIGSPAISILLPRLNDSRPEVQRMIFSALGGIGGEVVIEPIAARLESLDEETRIAAIEALAEIGDARCRQLIESRLNDSSANVRDNVAYWLRVLDKETENATK